MCYGEPSFGQLDFDDGACFGVHDPSRLRREIRIPEAMKVSQDAPLQSPTVDKDGNCLGACHNNPNHFCAKACCQACPPF